MTSTEDYKAIEEFRNSDGIITLNSALLKIMLYEDDERVFTLRFVPPWLTEEELRQELKLAFSQHIKIPNIRRQTKKITKGGGVF